MIFTRILAICLSLYSTFIFATGPLVSIVPINKPTSVARNGMTSGSYLLTNNSSTITSFALQPVPGVIQITDGSQVCKNPITLNGRGSTCQLNLQFIGSQIKSGVNLGPTICNNSPKPLACSLPSKQNLINLSLTAAEENTWLSVLIAQDSPPPDNPAITPHTFSNYVNQIYQLAPNAEQIHIRIRPFDAPTQCTDPTALCAEPYLDYVNVALALRQKYSPALILGFHPDNSDGSESYWGCSHNDWQCVLNYTILVMNNINAMIDTYHVTGYQTFSEEYPDYLIPQTVTADSIAEVKACLQNPRGASCPTAVVNSANPGVTFGDVLGNNNGFNDAIYGSNELDFGYIQYYNLVENVPESDNSLLSTGFFTDTSCASSPQTVTIIDANLTGSTIVTPYTLIPCNLPLPTYPANDVYTYAQSPQPIPDPIYAATYVGYLTALQAPLKQGYVPPAGTKIYTMYSGEPEFLGAPGWTLANISSFYTNLVSSINALCNPPYNNLNITGCPFTTNLNNMQFGIWNFTQILVNNP